MFLAFLKGSIGPRWRKQQGLPKPSIDSSDCNCWSASWDSLHPRPHRPVVAWWARCLPLSHSCCRKQGGLLGAAVSKVQPAGPVRRSLCGPSGCLVLGPQAMAAGVETGVPSRQGFKV